MTARILHFPRNDESDRCVAAIDLILDAARKQRSHELRARAQRAERIGAVSVAAGLYGAADRELRRELEQSVRSNDNNRRNDRG